MEIVRICLKIALLIQITSAEGNLTVFPDGFLFGVASAAYQIEGGWNEGGKGENQWDYYIHNYPDLILNRDNADVACDSYHKWREDIEYMKILGVDYYRFSIAWSRILPEGARGTEINQEGVDYYDNLINALISDGIQPYVTIYHWDLPQVLNERGGWLNESVIDDYAYYAEVLFQLFGDRVKHWMTFNEIIQFCENGYSEGSMAPFIKMPGVGGYLCAHNVLLSHGKIYRIYENKYKTTQEGSVGIAIDSSWCEPKTESEEDKRAAEQYLQFHYGWFINPLFTGNYPSIMIEKIRKLSAEQGFEKSRLPKFTPEESEMLKGSLDFLGLNHYSSMFCTFGGNYSQPSLDGDCDVQISVDKKWKFSVANWIKNTPWALRKLLVWIKEHYGNPTVLITENGWATSKLVLADEDRISFMKGYLSAVLEAIYIEGCNIVGYTVWSLLDNFEWTSGYELAFGLVSVDFDSPERPRTPKDSFWEYNGIISSRRIG